VGGVQVSQKAVFLNSEGDAWLERNHAAVLSRDYANADRVIREVIKISNGSGKKLKILEVGCSEGKRLGWMQENMNVEVFGVEPSAKAVALAQSNGLKVQQGSADKLPFESGAFDIVIFGFCLCWCDRDDLFTIAAEANRVLAKEAWVVIFDFYANTPTARDYHHKAGLFSYKMDNRKLFDWHPDYTCYSHQVVSHETQTLTDSEADWEAISVLRKREVRGAV
jgi:SAM-dependent methyltransferase